MKILKTGRETEKGRRRKTEKGEERKGRGIERKGYRRGVRKTEKEEG